MRKMNVVRRVLTALTVMGTVFIGGQASFAQGDALDLLDGLDDLVLVEDADEGELEPLLGEGEILMTDDGPITMPKGDVGALSGEGMIEEDTPAPVSRRSPILADPDPDSDLAVPVLPPPTVPAVKAVPIPPAAPVVQAPVAQMPMAQGTVQGNCLDCPPAIPVMEQEDGAYTYYVGGGHLFRGRSGAYHVGGRHVLHGGKRGGFGVSDGRRGARQPMQDPYYTLRGPRHFDDPNPRPIGP